MIIESAFDRIFRVLVVSVGLGSLVFGLLALPSIIEQYDSLEPTYTFVVIVVYCGLPIALGGLAFRLPVRTLRIGALVHSASTLILLAAWVPAMTVDRLPGDSIPWLINMVTASACMTALVLRPLLTWAYLLVVATESGVVRYVVYGGGDASLAVQDSIMITLLSSVLVSLLLLAARAGIEQDAVALAAQDAAAHVATVRMLESQRARFQAFMHDDVLATLNAASHGGSAGDDLSRRSAAAAVQKLDEFRDGRSARADFSMTEFELLLRTAVVTSGVALEIAVAPDAAALSVPVDTGDALAEALAEALRNSVRHAEWPDNRPVRRSALATLTASRIDIVTSDDGKGFVARRIGLDRLGIRVSILKRVNSQRGGFASVRSAKGEGTTVTLSWSAPGVHDGA
ncbi:MAG: hypothetical protein ACOH1T_08225 [Microbacteriaceae bacterium]